MYCAAHEIRLGRDFLQKDSDSVIANLIVIDQQMQVSGIYQDITNGGKTAKAVLNNPPDKILWHVVSMDIVSDISVQDKISEYANRFSFAKTTSIENYISQTLGNTLKQLELVVILAIIISLFISILITALFLKMLIAKDRRQIAILKSLGFGGGDIQRQYITRSVFVLLLGILLGAAAASTLGQGLIGMGGSMLGASNIQLIANLPIAYGVCPLLLATAVLFTALVCTHPIKKDSDLKMTVE